MPLDTITETRPTSIISSRKSTRVVTSRHGRTPLLPKLPPAPPITSRHSLDSVIGAGPPILATDNTTQLRVSSSSTIQIQRRMDDCTCAERLPFITQPCSHDLVEATPIWNESSFRIFSSFTPMQWSSPESLASLPTQVYIYNQSQLLKSLNTVNSTVYIPPTTEGGHSQPMIIPTAELKEQEVMEYVAPVWDDTERVFQGFLRSTYPFFDMESW